MQELILSGKFNPKKFDCQTFAVIQPHNTKFTAGNHYNIKLKNRPDYQKTVKLEYTRRMKFDRINDSMALMDSAYKAQELKKIMTKIWKNAPQMQFQFLIFKTITYEQADLFSLTHDDPANYGGPNPNNSRQSGNFIEGLLSG